VRVLDLEALKRRDPGLVALRRAARAAVVMPVLFWFGADVLHDPTVATFSAFGSFGLLLFADFAGPMRDRLLAEASLVLAGGVLLCVGTLASSPTWLAVVTTVVVGFGVLFSGVVSSVLASATMSLLLALVLPVSLAAPVSAIPDRLAGWGLAGAVSVLAVALLWPSPPRDALRGPLATAGRALAGHLHADVARLTGSVEPASTDDHRAAAAAAADALAALHRAFLSAPTRPTDLSTSGRAVVRLVDETSWLDAIVDHSCSRTAARRADPTVRAVMLAAASLLDACAELLDAPAGSSQPLRDCASELHDRLLAMQGSATRMPALATSAPAPVGDPAGLLPDGSVSSQVITALDPAFRAQELGYAVTQVATNVDLAAAAEQRGWLDRLLGRQPPGLPSTLSAARERAAAHLTPRSVWMRNSLRGGVALGLAVLVADLAAVEHSFWVVLGTLSVLRSNALSTGQNIARALAGTLAGFVVGAALVVPIGRHTAMLWVLLPVAVLAAGVAPSVISFAAGQAAFTVTLVILFNIIAPTGWSVGLLRVEDIAIGCLVSLVVGLLFWPRGAGAALGRALADAYEDGVAYLGDVVEVGLSRWGDASHDHTGGGTADTTAQRAAASSRRLDDAYRQYLSERGAKPLLVPDATSLVTGVVGVRLAADAVLDLWRDHAALDGDRTAAGTELVQRSEQLESWYRALAETLRSGGSAPRPEDEDPVADSRLVRALRRDLTAADGRPTSTAVRMIWTGDHLDAVRRLEASLAGAAGPR
jgi:uncharacterized membrane protein YccC